MPIISARNLSKAYGAQPLLIDATLTVRGGERVGLIGANGSGKSTLLRILAGEEVADTGVVDRRRDAPILYLSQEPTFVPESTPRQIVAEGLADWHAVASRHEELTKAIESGRHVDPELLEEQARLAESVDRLGGWTRGHVIEEMLGKLGVRDLDRAVGTMSGGERRRVALARLLVAQPALAILDEPTNHLDTDTIEWLEGYLVNDFPGSVLVVTHDRYVLDAICDRVLELDDGKLAEFIGGYADYLEQKAELLAQESRVEDKRLNFVRRERAWLSRGPRARSTKQKARIQRAESAIAKPALREADRLDMRGLETNAQRLSKTVLDWKDVALDLGGRRLIDGLTLHMVSGDRIGVIGVNGIGKTSLLKMATGELLPTRGEVVRGAGTRMAYFDQARAELNGAWSVFDNVAEREGAERSGAGAVQLGDRIVEMRSYLEHFLFDRQKQRQPVGSLSGGERARVALAKALKSGANLLLLDEPTNDLDVPTLGALEELLETWPGCAIVVSHDRYFLDRVATSILAFEGTGKVVRYPGGYETYRRLRDEAREAVSAPVASVPASTAKSERPAASVRAEKPLTYAERIELDGIMETIAAAESEVSSLEAKLADPALYTTRGAEAGRLRELLDAAHSEVGRLLARWELLEARSSAKN